MNLTISNLAIIDYAEIKIDGITIIAGENDTGKSTIGKVLFSLQNSLFKYNDQIIDERIRRLDSFLSIIFSSLILERESYNDFDLSIFGSKLYEEVQNEKIEVNSASLKAYFFSSLDRENIKHKKTFSGINDVVEQVERTLLLSDARILQTILQRTFISELGENLLNVFSDKSTGKISYSNEAGEAEISIKSDNIIEINYATSFESNVILLDNPYILDEITSKYSTYRFGSFSSIRHRNQLVLSLTDSQDETEIEQAFNELIVQDKLEEIFKKIDTICDGELHIKDRKGVYKSSSFESTLDIKSISSGLKTFAIIKTLLKKHVIKGNSIIILDEPEIHLHPQWQVALAEILVLMQKSFNLKLLITSHSPYFIDAIETYSMVFNTSNVCNYYMSEKKANGAVIFNCTGETEKIYKKLAIPFKMLEDLRIQYEK